MNRPKTVLIIDDDARNTFALSAVLRSRNYHCLVAATMEEGFTIMDGQDQPDIILLDMMMPGMDGYEAVPEIRSRVNMKTIPVIAVTAQAMPGDREKCLQAGANDYVSKPVDVDVLLTVLDKYLM